MAATTWQEQLDAASTVSEVVKVVKDFTSSLDHWDLAKLPVDCRPGKFFDAEDVSSFAMTVARYTNRGDAEADAIVDKLDSFFSYASVRLSRILNARTVDEQQSA